MKNSRSLLNRQLFTALVLLLLITGSAGLLLGRINRPPASENLLANPGFDRGALRGWQTQGMPGTQAVPKSGHDPTQTVLALQIPNSPDGSWVGVGQQVPLGPLKRYRFETRYRLLTEGESMAKLVLRVSQFNQAGDLLKAEEFSNPGTLSAGPPAAWQSIGHKFITTEETARVEVAVGLFGPQATEVAVDNLVVRRDPTPLTRIRQDRLAGVASLLLVAALLYSVGRLLWPVRARVLPNLGLALVSVLVTVAIAEVAIRFIPVNLVNPNWPVGYHIPSENGKSYRLAKNYPATFATDEDGQKHLVMSNSLGVRDREPPQNGSPLVLVLGDSMTFGWALTDLEGTWPRRLEQEVAARLPESKDYHFVNAGVSGYNTFQEVFLFEELLADMAAQDLKPDVALLSFFSGIWERNMYGPEGRFTVLNGAVMYTVTKKQLQVLPARLIDHSPFDDLKLIEADFFNEPHQKLLSNSRLYFVLSLLVINRLDNNWDEIPEVDPFEVNYQALKAFKAVAASYEIRPVVAYLPADNLFVPGKLAQHQAIVDQLSLICQQLDMPFLNPYDNMKKLGITADNAKETLTFVYNRHYSPEGNALYARALAPLLADFLARPASK